MAETCNQKLIVEVCNAKNLMPKDGQGTASAYAIVDFHGQRRRTKTVFRDLNPQWDEKLEFLIHDSESLSTEILELNIYNDKKTLKKSTFLGKVKIPANAFAKPGSESLVYYPLEKRSVFSQIKGEIGVKVWFVDETSPPPPPPHTVAEEQKSEEKQPEKEENSKAEEVRKEEAPGGEAEEEEKLTEDSKPVEAPAAAQPTVEVLQSGKEKVIVGKSGNLDLDDLELGDFVGCDRSGRNSYDLVDRMPFLFVRVVKFQHFKPEFDSPVIAKLVIGTHSINTKSQTQNKEFDQVFAFDKEGLNSTSLEVSVSVENKGAEGNLGKVMFDLREVPKRVPPDSALAPQWYSLEGTPEKETLVTEVMLAVWIGTQADEAFQEAWQSDSGGLIPATRAKVYISPKLWYLRLRVIQAQDLQLGSGTEPEPNVKNSELYIKAQLGGQLLKTSRVVTVGLSSLSSNPTWNEDLIFVAAEPFVPFLVVTVEDVTNGSVVGHSKIPMASVVRRTDDKSGELRSRWFDLVGNENSRPYSGRIHVVVCLEGGYHVPDEAAHVTSDVRATANQLAKPPIGLLEVGIRGATNLLPVKKTKHGSSGGTTDAYVVSKYGPKWVRTRTILDRFNPRWNEQYTWNVYDPCTVLTIGVFDNGRYKNDEAGNQGKDVRMGKLRVRLSTLDTNRMYIGSHSLTMLLPGGAKKMGDIEIAVRFTCSSWLSLIQAYASPTLPRMHYVSPLGPMQQDILRHAAMRIVTARLARSEPALGHEVVQYMLDSDAQLWSMRRSKSNWFRFVRCLSKAATFAKWIDGIRTWVHPPVTVLFHALLVAIVLCPHLVLPTMFIYALMIIGLRFRYRQRVPFHIDSRLSYVDVVGPDELDEEFDGFPTTRSADQVRIRYDRLRALAGRAQMLLGDMAAQGERLEALFNWKDPRATGIFGVVCLLASLVFYVVPLKVLVLGFGFYYLRHPRFRGDMPSVPVNFFRRLPSSSDHIL